ncbi:hypothetical protein MTsDn5_38090 [Alteromonas gracilis]
MFQNSYLNNLVLIAPVIPIMMAVQNIAYLLWLPLGLLVSWAIVTTNKELKLTFTNSKKLWVRIASCIALSLGILLFTSTIIGFVFYIIFSSVLALNYEHYYKELGERT